MSSLWIDTSEGINFPCLEEDKKVEVCIIGGGLTGLACAYYLTQAGFSVVLLEKDKIGSKTSGNTTAKITSQHGLFYDYLASTYGLDASKEYLFSQEKAIQDIKEIIEKNNIACDFEIQNNYVYTTKQEEVPLLQKEQKTLEKLSFSSKLEKEIPLPVSSVLAAIMFPNQAQFHPRKYMFSLCNLIKKNGASIYENTKVYDVKKEMDSYLVKTKNYTVSAKYVILATHFPILNIPGFYFLKMYQETSYLIALNAKEPLFPGMYITAKTPTTSFRTAKINGKELLLVGGYNHKTGAGIDNKEAYHTLEKVAKSLYPNAELKYCWNARDCISVDKIPYIGTYSVTTPGLYVATGFKKWGMTNSHVAARILTNLILGKEENEDSIYNSTRFHPIKHQEEVKNIVKQTYTSLVSLPLKKIKTTISDLNPGDGKIVEYEGNKIGIYLDEKGNYHAIKPFCSHLGCTLTFNNLDKTWDCPCHGSRFDCDGHSLYEPSIKDLEMISMEED